MSDDQVKGLALEKAFLYWARRFRGLRVAIPKTIRVRSATGRYYARGANDDARIPEELDRMVVVAGRVARALRLRGVDLRGALCCGTKDGSFWSVDLRLRVGGALALGELKFSTDLRRAKRKAPSKFPVLRRLAHGGTWRGPHPRRGKRASAALVAALAGFFADARGGATRSSRANTGRLAARGGMVRRPSGGQRPRPRLDQCFVVCARCRKQRARMSVEKLQQQRQLNQPAAAAAATNYN